MLKIYNFIIQILRPHFIFGTGAPKIYNKRERSPGHYHKPRMGGRYHMERQWRPTQDLQAEQQHRLAGIGSETMLLGARRLRYT
jgi:hypothetical protein